LVTTNSRRPAAAERLFSSGERRVSLSSDTFFLAALVALALSRSRSKFEIASRGRARASQPRGRGRVRSRPCASSCCCCSWRSTAHRCIYRWHVAFVPACAALRAPSRRLLLRRHLSSFGFVGGGEPAAVAAGVAAGAAGAACRASTRAPPSLRCYACTASSARGSSPATWGRAGTRWASCSAGAGRSGSGCGSGRARWTRCSSTRARRCRTSARRPSPG